MAARRPARLARNRHGVFCLRWIVPKRFRDADGKPREVRVSLRTRDAQRARILAMEINLAYERVLQMTKNFDPRQMSVPWTLAVGDLRVDVADEKDLASFNAFLEKHPEIKQTILKKIEQGMSPDQVLSLAQKLLADKPAPVAAALLAVDGFPTVSGPAAPAGITPVKLLEAIDNYAGTRESLSGNRGSTASEKRRTMELMVEFMGRCGFDIEKTFVHQIGRIQCLDFIHHYTSRGGKAPTASTVSKAANKGGRPPKAATGLAARTVIKAVGHLREFCNFAVAKQMMASNPIDDAFESSIDGIRKKASVARKNNSYRSMSIDELQKIFDPETHLGFNSTADYFWIALLGLFTGARLGELMTRQLDDIRVDPRSGLLVLRIFDETGEQLKTRNSQRLVPIAQRLLEIGFGRYVEHVRSLGATKLFPHLKEAATRGTDPTKNQSRRFSEYLKHIGLKEGDLVFHSFRHTAITVMHVGGVPLMDTELIAGHAAQDLVREIDNVNGGGRRSWSATQPTTYIHADTYERDGQSLMSRLKGHIDRTLDFDLDYPGLACAAEIVQQNTTVTLEAGRPVFKSGWHTNAKAYTEKMLAQLKACRSKTAAG
ncbi:tyrosine-type recombinase/integrase [Piscinibacter sakaiensis]|uniref:tyrosine-type recombinase/integrase n=1 Tax=Piscinibacter sakaiensis TaxID=1547922 RepID=UPI003AAC6ECE